MEMLERETKKPQNKKEWHEMRSEVITSTEVSALFGCCPYITEYELWFRKRDKIMVEIEENDRMKWGTRLQDPVAMGIAHDNGWDIRYMNEFITIPSLRIGSSFDYMVKISDAENAILEIKVVDDLVFKNKWIDEDGIYEASPHIELQAQHQLLVSGQKTIYIGAFIGGNKVVLIQRKPIQSVFDAILKKTEDFWKSVDKGISPSPDFPRDASFIIDKYQFAEPGKTFDASDNKSILEMVEEYQALGRTEKMAKERRDTIKANILMQVGDAERVIAPSFTISAGVVGPAHVEYDREGYRSFRVFDKKTKEKK